MTATYWSWCRSCRLATHPDDLDPDSLECPECRYPDDVEDR